jgi:hypothetical protein
MTNSYPNNKSVNSSGFDSKGFLCWSSDLGFSNVRWNLCYMMKAMNLVWKGAKNGKQIVFVTLNNQAHCKAVSVLTDSLSTCEILPGEINISLGENKLDDFILTDSMKKALDMKTTQLYGRFCIRPSFNGVLESGNNGQFSKSYQTLKKWFSINFSLPLSTLQRKALRGASKRKKIEISKVYRNSFLPFVTFERENWDNSTTIESENIGNQNFYEQLILDNTTKDFEAFINNPLAREAHVIVFSHSENIVELVTQVRKMGIPSIGFVSLYSNYNPQVYKFDYPIFAGDPKNQEAVMQLLKTLVYVSKRAIKPEVFDSNGRNNGTPFTPSAIAACVHMPYPYGSLPFYPPKRGSGERRQKEKEQNRQRKRPNY